MIKITHTSTNTVSGIHLLNSLLSGSYWSISTPRSVPIKPPTIEIMNSSALNFFVFIVIISVFNFSHISARLMMLIIIK